MDWNQAVGVNREKLSKADHVLRRALKLAELLEARVDDKKIAKLKAVEGPVRRQLRRLERNEFRIAVVGLEKAGKSTFVNAYLGADILPNDNPRCTFTTTQVHSLPHSDRQRIIVETKGEDSFQKYRQQLSERAVEDSEAGKNAKADLDTINKHEDTLLEIIRKGPQEIPFERLEAIKDELKKYVADERYAHAVQEVRLHTDRLAKADGVVLFDVPGLDSGLGKHLEESRQMLEDCDAVICVQRSDTPSLKAGEQELIRFVKKGDPVLGLDKKLFVFFGQIDRCGTAEAFKDNLRVATDEWNKYGLTNQARIVPGSAAAYLFQNNAAGEILKKNAGPSVIDDLKRIRGAAAGEDTEALTGIPQVKQIIERYLKEERVELLNLRCDEYFRKIVSTSRAIYDEVASVFSEDPEEAAKMARSQLKTKLDNWFNDTKWEAIKADFVRFYRVLNNSAGEDDTQKTAHLEPSVSVEFRQRYNEIIAQKLADLPHRRPERRGNFFDGHSVPFDAAGANNDWRKKLYTQVIDAINDISLVLTEEILDHVGQMTDKISNLLWDLNKEKVKQNIITRSSNLKDLKDKINHGFQTLFLRFSRPVARVLIQAPFNTNYRENIRKDIKSDIHLLDPYYDCKEEKPEYRRLASWVQHGQKLQLDSKTRATVLGLPEEGPRTEWAPPPDPSTEVDVIDEVEADLKALEAYLVHAVFHAAGFEAYRRQELEQIYNAFVNGESYCRQVMDEKFFEGNQRLLAEVPAECRLPENNTEVSERLKQLRTSFEQAEKTRFEALDN